MGVSTNYLGHIEISPPLNQAEYDYLTTFSRSRRSFRDAGPYAVWPQDPHDEVPMLHGDEAAARVNRIADGQPGYRCQWVPCPTGCCLGWDGHEKFYAGAPWLQYLIDHFLRPGAHARRSGDGQFRRFTFDHDTNGVVVGEQEDNRELFSLTVRHGKVSRRTLRRGEPMPWDAGWVETPELPWLADWLRPSERYRLENEATLAELRASTTVDGG